MTGETYSLVGEAGYSRGLACSGRFAVIGLSKQRENRTFTGLPLDDELTRHGAEARCGLMVVDLRTGDAVHWVRIEGVVEERYDIAVVPGVRRPMAIGLKTDEIRRMITVGEPVPYTPISLAGAVPSLVRDKPVQGEGLTLRLSVVSRTVRRQGEQPHLGCPYRVSGRPSAEASPKSTYHG